MKLGNKLILILGTLVIFLVVAAVVICSVPLKEVSYTVEVPYQDTETYTEIEPYQIKETIVEERESERYFTRAIWPEYIYWYTFEVREPTIFIGHISFKGEGNLCMYTTENFPPPLIETMQGTFWDSQKFNKFQQASFLTLRTIKEERFQFSAEPNNLYYITFYACGHLCWGEYKLSLTKRQSIPVEKLTTKYKEVEKQRTVWKVRPETRYKKVTLIDYLMQYSKN